MLTSESFNAAYTGGRDELDSDCAVVELSAGSSSSNVEVRANRGDGSVQSMVIG
jgi:hypothetical protein